MFIYSVCSQTSFDLGPSFMDEVLKALNEKEKQLSPDVLTPTETKSFEDDAEVLAYSSRNNHEETLPTSCVPPLPAQPPRVVCNTYLYII